ncbi:hypothetical protein N7488_012133 [Penicillium malachiteum]|nr:hypothetical protein N7488_012133 [Penicillium malachiteum]
MDTESKIRKRIPKSCRRCHRRKQKCVGFPTCTNCENAKEPCSRSERAPSWHHAMSKGALVRRIELLEDQLAALEEKSTGGRDKSEQADITAKQHSSRWSSTKCHQIDGVVRFLTLGHGLNEDQQYLGPTSGVSMVENVNRMIQDTVVGKLLPVNSNNQTQDSSPQNDEDVKVPPPDDGIGSRILDAYFKNMHIRLPFLDRNEIFRLHAQRHEKAGKTPHEQFGKFKIFMVYAIGAAILQMTQTYESTPPNAFLVTALQFDPTLRESISIASIEAMLLLVLYNLRSTSNSSVWYMIGLAMRACVDFGLHRDMRYKCLQPCEAQLQRRLFWSVYLIERHTAWSLGRPFSIMEEEIDTKPPDNVNDTIDGDEGLEGLNESYPGTRSQQHKPTLGRFIGSIGLQRIVSQIQTRIYRVDKQSSVLLPEVPPLMSKLQEFKETLPSLDLAEEDFVLMHWNNSVRILLQPFLSILPPQDKLISICLFASGQMCQLFKKLRQRDSSSHSFLLVNSVFMAGLTMCFCLFRSPNLWSPAVSNDIRACSSTLSVMAERNPKLKKYRDGLETVINRAMEYVEAAYQTTPSHDTGIPTYLQAQSNQYLHSVTTPDSITGMEPQMQPLHHGQPQGIGSDVYDFQMLDIFSDIPGLPSNLQSLFSGDHADMLDTTFQGVFSENLWATEMDTSFLEEGSWNL